MTSAAKPARTTNSGTTHIKTSRKEAKALLADLREQLQKGDKK